MFKPGELALIRATKTVTKVQQGLMPDGSRCVRTDAGDFEESELLPAHPTVLETVQATSNLDREISRRLDIFPSIDCKVSYDLLDELKDLIPKKLTFDASGHWRRGRERIGYGDPFKSIHLFRHMLSMSDAQDLLHAMQRGEELDRWIPLDIGVRFSGYHTCSHCGEDYLGTETNGKIIRISGEPCKYPDGIPPTEWELNVPSGKLIIANDLRDFFPLEDDEYDCNGVLARAKIGASYATIGLSHAFVGNTSPGVYKYGEDSYRIMTCFHDSEDDADQEDDIRAPDGAEFLASICTELWWYSICDVDELNRRAAHFKIDPNDYNIEAIDVKPGVYRFRHDHYASPDDVSENGTHQCVYSWFEWVREPDPVQNLLEKHTRTKGNVFALVRAKVEKWPILFGVYKVDSGGKTEYKTWSEMTEKERCHSWQRVADHLLASIGNGISWHEDGFPLCKIDDSIQDVDPPSFRQQYYWYPFSSKHSALFTEVLDSAFTKLAFRVLESIISFGMNVYDGDRNRDINHTRKLMGQAVERYRELIAQHSDLADPEYVIWLSQPGRAEDWVKNFDLGPEFTERHIKKVRDQRWIPEDTYALAFNAKSLEDGNFSHHPCHGGGWAHKKDAQRFAILELKQDEQSEEPNCFWTPNARETSVPLWTVARIIKLGDVSHMGEVLVELAFDYGTPWMQDISKRKAIGEFTHKGGIRLLTREEYEKRLPIAITYFDRKEREAQEQKESDDSGEE